MKKQIRFYISLLLELIVFLSSTIGIIISLSISGDQFMGGKATLLYFTIQSNMWIGLTSIFLFTIKLLEKYKKTSIIKKWMYVVKYVFTVSITLTGSVYCLLLAPFLPEGYNAWSIANVLTHVIVPICSVADIFVDEYKFLITKKMAILTLTPPLYYLIFVLIGYALDFTYCNGENYPYFFLNFRSNAGFFGFVKEPLEIGSFYWLMLMIGIVLGIAFIYRFVFNKINKEDK